jgi:uncharacterized phage protein gp47/JayE
MLITLAEDQILQDMIDYLSANTPITDFREGSIARAILAAVAKQINKQYQMLDIQSRAGYISTTSGLYMDLIGDLLNCPRYANEPESNYRYRIAHQVQTVAGSNEEAIRLLCLAIPDVKNVIVKNYARGIGTFDVYVITNESVTPSSILTQAQQIIDKYAAGGISGIAVSPTPIPIDLKLRLVCSGDTASNVVKGLVRNSIAAYFDGLDLGGSLVIDQVTKAIMNASELIQEFDYIELKVNNRATSPANYPATSNERLYLRDLVIE